MNSVNVIGRLVADPELRHTQSGVTLCKIRVAVDRAGDMDGDQPGAGFFNVTFWNKTAENVAAYFSKGKQIAVTGSLRHHTWETDEGDKRSSVEINAFGFSFVGKKSDSDDDGSASSGESSGDDFGTQADPDDDIPW